MTSESDTSSQAALSPETSNSASEETSFLGSIKLFGKKVFSAMEYWVMDGMSQEEWEAAQAVAAERQAQDAAADMTYTDPLVVPQETEMACEQKSPVEGTTTEGDITLQNV